MSLERRWHAMRWRLLDVVLSERRLEDWKRVPELPSPLRRRRYRLAPRFPRQHFATTAPSSLRTAPGVVRDEQAAWEAYRQAPLRDFWHVYPQAEVWIFKVWAYFLWPVLSRYLRGIDMLAEIGKAKPAPNPEPRTPEQLSRLIRAEAARLGLTAVGFAPHDPRYVYHEFADVLETGSVIICVLEEDYESEQSA